MNDRERKKERKEKTSKLNRQNKERKEISSDVSVRAGDAQQLIRFIGV